MELRVIVAGTRTYNDYNKLDTYVSSIIYQKIHDKEIDNIRIVSGGAKGADELGEQYARNHGYDLSRFPADWDKLGKRAGCVRNEQMAKFALEEGNHGVLIAFWDGKSRGTSNMIDIASRYNMDYYICKFNNSNTIPYKIDGKLII